MRRVSVFLSTYPLSFGIRVAGRRLTLVEKKDTLNGRRVLVVFAKVIFMTIVEFVFYLVPPAHYLHQPSPFQARGHFSSGNADATNKCTYE